MKRVYWLIGLVVAGSGGFYLGWAALTTTAGFPLDDAWIHQVFARNLAQYTEFSYNPGQPVAGSTSPLWTLMLVPGYWVGGEAYKGWAYLLGLLFLGLSALEVARLYQLLFSTNSHSENKASFWTAGSIAALFSLFEWRLVWAAVSGMETLLFTFGTLRLLRYYLQLAQAEAKVTFRPAKAWPAYAWLGLGGGLLTLVRPEGMVLLGLVGLDTGRRFFLRRNWGGLVVGWLTCGLGWAIPLIPYVLFNYSVGGRPLPTTFYAKAGYYGNDRSAGAILEYFGQALFELVIRGPVFLLLPGFFIGLYCSFWLAKADWRPLVWPGLLLMLYAVQLPVTYQHGRYLMPLIPFLILYGVYGTAELIGWLQKQNLPFLARLLPFVLAFPVAIAWFNGAQAYQFDVKLINDEQVRVGRWLHDNTPLTASVASHDIGAIGYFSGRKLVDIAGLVSPEYGPIVLNQPAILAKLRSEGVSYLALYPDWYPSPYLNDLLRREGRKVFEPPESYLAAFGKDNMVVFKL